MIEYEDLTDCPTCPMLATDRDDALRTLGLLHEVNAWRASWMERAASELHDIAHLLEDMTPTDDTVSMLQRIGDLIAEEWGDGEDDDSDDD